AAASVGWASAPSVASVVFPHRRLHRNRPLPSGVVSMASLIWRDTSHLRRMSRNKFSFLWQEAIVANIGKSITESVTFISKVGAECELLAALFTQELSSLFSGGALGKRYQAEGGWIEH